MKPAASGLLRSAILAYTCIRVSLVCIHLMRHGLVLPYGILQTHPVFHSPRPAPPTLLWLRPRQEYSAGDYYGGYERERQGKSQLPVVVAAAGGLVHGVGWRVEYGCGRGGCLRARRHGNGFKNR